MIVLDASGLVVAAGLIAGDTSVIGDDIVALDSSMLIVDRFIVAQFEGNRERIEIEHGLIVDLLAVTWQAVRPWSLYAALRTEDPDLIDSYAALVLAETSGAPLVTTNTEISSDLVAVIHP